MSSAGQHDTLRRVMTSAAIVGAALVMIDGGRGLTGRAGGGQLGCGGSLDADGSHGEITEVFERPGSFETMGYQPVLRPGEGTLEYRLIEIGQRPERPTPLPGLTTRAPSPVVPLQPRTGITLPPAQPPLGTGSVLDGLQSSGAGRFVELVRQAGLDAILSDSLRRFTVFAPTDEAVERLVVESPWLFDSKNQQLLVEVVAQHIVVDRLLGAGSWAAGSLPSMSAGAELELVLDVPEPLLLQPDGSKARVQAGSEYLAGNGLVHLIDRVLVPRFTPWAHLRNAGFHRFAEVLVATQRVHAFTDPNREITILAPLESAFDRVGWDMNHIHDPGHRQQMNDMLDAHVIEGSFDANGIAIGVEGWDGMPIELVPSKSGRRFLDRDGGSGVAELVQADIAAGAGYIHGIDAILTP